ncbi:MAG: VacJ family lipoprotein [Alphaproteobacteria bacterium]
MVSPRPQAAPVTAAQPAGPSEFNDPIEGFNRRIFAFNLSLDRTFLQPTARAYRWTVPKAGRRSVTNFINNLNTPVILANDLLQGELVRGFTTTERFVLNSTFGIAGFFDIARGEGLERHSEDFGQTLAVWGVGPGPYLMVPMLGPSDPRDGIGIIVDQAFDPTTWAGGNNIKYATAGLFALNIVSEREANMDQFNEIERTSIDFYAQVRSIYFQTRRNEIKNGKTDFSDLPDISNLDEK